LNNNRAETGVGVRTLYRVAQTRFEQVPLEVVKKVVEEQAKRGETTESGRGTKKEELEQLLLAISRANGKGRKT
jgi:hypothetical protein